jgi:hypothetical protein
MYCKHTWSIERISKDANDSLQFYGMHWESEDTVTFVSSSFNFPGFTFKGGEAYLVSLSVLGPCGFVEYTDTVIVPLQARINITHAQTYSNPVGPSAIQLQGTTMGASTFSWNPTTYLTNSSVLNPVSLPSTPIQYVLTAFDGNTCHDYDTVNIMHNEMAFAGSVGRICDGDSFMLGTSFDGTLMLGLYGYLASPDFINYYDNSVANGNTYHRHFTKFLLQSYSTYYTPGHPYYNFVEMESLRKRIQATKWYTRFFDHFVRYEGYKSDFSTTFYPFRYELTHDLPLRAEVDSLYLTYNRTIMDEMFNAYQDYLSNEEYSAIEINWEYKELGDTSWTAFDGANGNTYWRDYNNIWDHPGATRTYRITVIDNNLSTVEFDSVTVFVDSALTASFYPAYQADSTIQFYNNTINTNDSTGYSWNFGDGSLSSLMHPSHTFPAFDSNYVVCLTVTNGCGSFMYCDTVNVDTNGILGFFAKRDNREIPQVAQSTQKPSKIAEVTKAYLSSNRPNPFSKQTTIAYCTGSHITNGKLRISSPLGQVLYELNLSRPVGEYQFDASGLADGMYYYSLVVDGVVIDSKTMLVAHE